MSTQETIGFIGLGVMGGPMCRNMAQKHAGRVLGFDLDPAAAVNLDGTKGEFVTSIAAVAAPADIVFLSLPGGKQVEAVSAEVARHARTGAIIVDFSTTSVASARAVEKALAASGIAFADAPVARTREAAQKGELSIMVGAPDALYARIRPLLDMVASDVTHGGGIGTGQVLKLVNNMLVFEHVAALAEMMVVAERAGVSPHVLLDAVSKGSGDSFVLRNHGRKAMLPRSFPDKAFPPEYVLKDIGYVLELAESNGVHAALAERAQRYYQDAIEAGLGGRYFPVVLELIEKQGKP
jgi:3-hydroxyisobutyrate dehydrogenase-like beta-hydroxyacid dehydrogenase